MPVGGEEEQQNAVDVLGRFLRPRHRVFPEIDPDDIGGAGHGVGRICALKLKRPAALVGDFALDHGGIRLARGSPSVLPGQRARLDLRQFERLGEQRECRKVVGNERIAAPGKFKGIGKAISVGVREKGGGAVDAAFHFVGDSVAVGVARGVGGEIDATACRGQGVVSQAKKDREAGVAPKVRPGGYDAIRLEIERVQVDCQSPREDVDVRECAQGIDGHAAYAGRAGTRRHTRYAAEKEDIERRTVVTLSGNEHQCVADFHGHVGRLAGVGVDPAIWRIGRLLVQIT